MSGALRPRWPAAVRLLLGLGLVASAPVAPARAERPLPLVAEHARPDGARALIAVTAQPSAAVRLRLGAGARERPAQPEAVAVLVRTLLADGPARGPDGVEALSTRLERLGARLSLRDRALDTVIGVDAPAGSIDEAVRLVLLRLSTPRLSIPAAVKAWERRHRRPFDVDGRRARDALDAALHRPSAEGDGEPPTADALISDYRAVMRPDRWTLVAVGAVSEESVARWLESSLLIPTPDSAPREPAPQPRALPATVAARATPRQVVVGYAGCPLDAAACRVWVELARADAAAGLEAELGVGAVVESAFAEIEDQRYAALRVRAGRWKGVLPRLRAAFARAAKPSPRALALARSRLSAEREADAADPAAFADRLVDHVAAGRTRPDAIAGWETATATTSAADVARVAQAGLDEARAIEVRLTPVGR